MNRNARALILVALAALPGCASSRGRVGHRGPDDVVLQSHIYQVPTATRPVGRSWTRLLAALESKGRTPSDPAKPR